MAIDMPTSPGFINCRFGLQTNTQTWKSPLTGDTQRAKLAGDLWTASYTLPPMNRPQAAVWKAFLRRLRGQFNTFNAFDPDGKTPRGKAGGTPLVNGGLQTGNSLVTDGWPANTLVLKADDYVSWGELKAVSADVTSDGSGNATITFEPSIRSSPADNTAITVTRATCTMILTDDSQAIWDCDKNGIYPSKTFSAIEVF